MSDKSLIEWTDATWNVITGCEIESPGCKNCYAMKLAGTRLRNHPSRAGLTHDSAAGPVWTGEVRFNEQWLKQPLQWKRARMIFVVAHGDLFHPGVPFEWIDRVFAVMAVSGRHTYQVLTKRTARMAEYILGLSTPAGSERLERAARSVGYTLRFEGIPTVGLPLSNVWLGTSVETQRYADLRREPLGQLAAGGWLTWVSYEPALESVDWSGWEFIDWLVAGGESGDNARPSHPQWFRRTRDYCGSHDIAFNFKQWGQWSPAAVIPGGDLGGEMRKDLVRIVAPHGEVDGHFRKGNVFMRRAVKRVSGRALDGVEHNGFPDRSRA